MPAVSRSQQRMFAIAAHAPSKLRKENRRILKLSDKQLSEFSHMAPRGNRYDRLRREK